jgi:hypothetical protein
MNFIKEYHEFHGFLKIKINPQKIVRIESGFTSFLLKSKRVVVSCKPTVFEIAIRPLTINKTCFSLLTLVPMPDFEHQKHIASHQKEITVFSKV